MIKILAVLLSSLFVTPIFTVLPVKTAEKALNTSVLLRMKTQEIEGKRHYGGCSGTYIAPRLILTAAHCFTGENVEFVWARDYNQVFGVPVHLIRLNAAKDLALLEAPFNHSYAKIGKDPKRGDEVLNVGSPLNFEFVVSNGVVGATDVKMHGFTSRYILTTAMINPGSSGGGAFNNKGELIGVNTMLIGFLGWSGISLAVSTADIRQFIQYMEAY